MMSLMAWYVGMVCGHGPEHESDDMGLGMSPMAWYVGMDLSMMA